MIFVFLCSVSMFAQSVPPSGTADPRNGSALGIYDWTAPLNWPNDATKFLRGDRSWAVPGGGGGITSLAISQQREGRVSSATVATNPFALGDSINILAATLFNGSVAPDATGGQRTDYESSPGAVDSAYGIAGDALYRTGRNISVAAALQFRDTTDVRQWFAMTNAAATGGATGFGASDSPAAQYAGFRFSTLASDTTFKCITSDNVAQTIIDSGIIPDGKEHRFSIVFDDVNLNVKFYIDGALVGASTTHLPPFGQNMRYYFTSLKHVTVPGAGNLVSLGYIICRSDL